MGGTYEAYSKVGTQPTVPVTVEYEITELGKTLIEPLEVLLRWSEQHKADVLIAQEIFDNNQRTANA